jgi:hypothetical protein
MIKDVVPDHTGPAPSLTVVLNWTEELTAKLPR